jgi:hypothetical protein
MANPKRILRFGRVAVASAYPIFASASKQSASMTLSTRLSFQSDIRLPQALLWDSLCHGPNGFEYLVPDPDFDFWRRIGIPKDHDIGSSRHYRRKNDGIDSFFREIVTNFLGCG